MMRTGWQKTWVRIVTTLLTAAVMLMIFFFSTENAEQSDNTSGRISLTIIRMIHPEYERLSESLQREIYDATQRIVRKIAHFSEYFMLGFLARLCLESWFGKRERKNRMLAFTSIGAGLAYACSDELHQMYVAGRAGAWTDVLVDGSGVISGAMLASMLINKSAGKKK